MGRACCPGDRRTVANSGTKLVTRGIAVVIALLVIGFVVFANSISTKSKLRVASADGIVVLTGGASRIQEAVKLLAEGKAKRLLISGVNRSTTRQQLESLVPGNGGLFTCCIDIDRRAVDTIGNAEESRAWASNLGFSTLILVTSAYHMPRSLLEFERVMPGVKVTPYPVNSHNTKVANWWSHPVTMRVLVKEYVKYIRAAAVLGAERLWYQVAAREADSETLGSSAQRP